MASNGGIAYFVGWLLVIASDQPPKYLDLG